MSFRIFLGMAIVGFCLMAGGISNAQEPGENHIVPLRASGVLAMDKRIEAVRGDRTKPSEPFVIRIHAEAGYIIMPHTHPVDENIVLVSGSWTLGMGDRFKKAALQPME